MKILVNGQGVLIDDRLETLDSPEKLQDEIQKANNGKLELVKANGIDSVVSVDDYIEYLQNELDQYNQEQKKQDEMLKKKALLKQQRDMLKVQQERLNAIKKREEETDKTNNVNVDSEMPTDKALLERANTVISELMKIIDNQKDEIDNCNHVIDMLIDSQMIFSSREFNFETKNKIRGSISISPSVRQLVEKMSTKTMRVSTIGQIALLRGIYGDERAEEIVNQLYNNDTLYQKFLARLK